MAEITYPKVIEFKRVPTPEDLADNYEPYCTSIADADHRNIVDPDSIVAPASIKIRFSYPLTRKITIIVNEPAPITRSRFAQIIFQQYAKIYQEEDESTSITPGELPGMYNRNHTNGKYGIWGHSIGDLDLVDATLSDSGVYNLAVDS